MQKYRASSFRFFFALMLVFGILPMLALAQNRAGIVGDWEGTLDPGAQAKKRIVVHISAAQDGSLTGTIDYPDQNVSGVLITAITYKDHALHFEISSIPALYDGTMDEAHTQITGTWKPSGSPLSLILKRTS
ncbi:MAG: hypothetical protein WAU58_07075 [Terriglobales bacterium]